MASFLRSQNWLIALPLLCISAPVVAEEDTPPLALDGSVELNSIYITRWKASDSAASADLTNMRLELWISMPKAQQYLLRVKKLDDIVDDTGKNLLTEQRRGRIESLEREVRAAGVKAARGKGGPILEFTLDAPARGAKTIRSIKGQFEITSSGSEIVKLKDFSKLVGTRLEHDLLKELAIVPSLDRREDYTDVELKLTGQHDHLLAWTLAKDGEPMRESSLGSGPAGDAANSELVSKGYRDLVVDESTELWLRIANKDEEKLVDFEFKDIELP
jgi:hypothetical protein